MRWHSSTLVVFILAIAPVQGQEKIELFNGKDLTGWLAEGAKDLKDPKTGTTVNVWSIRDGLLHCEGKGFGFLRYINQDFGDFRLHVEYRMNNKGCNSGIGVRTGAFDPKRSRETRPSFFSYEIQLFDDAGKPATAHSTGSLYRYVAPRVNANRAVGEWNAIDIECRGPQVTVVLNGEKVIDFDQTTLEATKNKPLKGSVCLQNHGGNIDFRNVHVAEIKAAAKTR